MNVYFNVYLICDTIINYFTTMNRQCLSLKDYADIIPVFTFSKDINEA